MLGYNNNKYDNAMINYWLIKEGLLYHPQNELFERLSIRTLSDSLIVKKKKIEEKEEEEEKKKI